MTREEALSVLQDKSHFDTSVYGYEAIDVAIEALKAEPVKHGKWIEVNSYECEHHSVTDMRCNVCGKYSSIVLPHKTTFIYPYCPYCRAKMDGGEADG